MALRSPIYLDTETLLAHADYYDIDLPRQADIVEKSVRRRSGGGKLNVPGLGAADASVGRDVEFQSSYRLEPREKATVSKVIDGLINEGAVRVEPDGDTPLSKDDLVEIEGTTRITAASLAGKMFYIFRRLMDIVEGDPQDIFDLDVDDVPIVEQLKQVYLRNELLPLPILLELTGANLPQRVYVSVPPDHFVDAASANRIEGELRVLGSVSHLIDDSDDGYLSAERWLLHDWEYLIKRKLMLQVGDVVKDLVEKLDLDLPAEDVHCYISGPAIVIEAIALY